MQIILNQADIEKAIKQHVAFKMKIPEADVPAIDLKATRGPEGFTAVIDLDDAPDTSTTATKPLGIVEKARAAKPVAAAKVEATTPVETAQDAAEPPFPEAEATAQADAEVEQVQADADPEADPEQEGDEAEASAEPPPETEKPRSLFANLAKPRNN